MKTNLDDEISMIKSLKRIYSMFKVGNSGLLGINMTVLSKKGIYVRIDALDRSRSLEILEGHGVGQRVRRLLRAYWSKSTMVARAGGYYMTGFKGERA